MKNSRQVLSFLVLLYSSIGFSQDQKTVDSLLAIVKTQKDTSRINTYRSLFFEFIYADYKKAGQYNALSRKYAYELGNKDFIARTTNEYGVYHLIISDYRDAVKILDTAYTLYEELGNKERMSALLNNKANALRSLGQMDAALETHMKSLKIKEELGLTGDPIGASYWNIGNIHGDMGNYNISNEYYRKALKIYEALNQEEDVLTLNNLLAINYKNLKDYSKAIPVLKESIEAYRKFNRPNDEAGAYDNLGQLYVDMDSLDQALENFEKSLAISKENGERSLVGLNLRNIGDVYLKQGNAARALPLFQEALKISKETGTNKKMILDYKKLAAAHADLGHYKLAYENHVNYHELNDSLIGKETEENFKELEAKYQTEKKEQQLELQKSQINLLEEKQQKGRLRNILLISVSIITLALLIAIYYALRQKIRRKEAEEEKLQNEIDYKKRELTAQAVQLAHKNEMLEKLKVQLNELSPKSNTSQDIQRLVNDIRIDMANDANWLQFKSYFEEVHQNFYNQVKTKYPVLSQNDLRLIALLKMNLSSKEIANVLNVSPEGIKKSRYRLRKKLELDTEDSLEETIMQL
ncbi:MAG: hypothetical protein CL868_14060 [Cytophagaceae bacterium]|nr:hypothetical protein [Cytophagaceae bacterium]|tara:strand:- start:635 stop:2380 length:1746 start_codon:yes stop_codon:yes gene_type:complete